MSGIQWDDLKGKLLLITPLSVETVSTAFREKEAVREAQQEPQQDQDRPTGIGARDEGDNRPTSITQATIDRAKRQLQRVTEEGELLPGAASSRDGVSDDALREVEQIARKARERNTRELAEPVDGSDQPN